MAVSRSGRSEAGGSVDAIDIFGRNFVIVTLLPVAIFPAVRAGGAPEEP